MALAQTAPQAPASAQTPGLVRVEFDEAVRRAIDRNPTVAQAATAIAQAEGVLRQTRSTFMPTVGATVTNVAIDGARGFSGGVTQPRDQVFFGADISMPIFAPARWAAANQNRDQIDVTTKQAAEARQQIAVATAQAYLAVIAAHRQIEVEERALEVARVHQDYAQKRLEGGAGSRLNQLRAAQEVSSQEAQLEETRLLLVRAQEALGVLMAESGPVDAMSDPVFEVPGAVAETEWMAARPDARTQQSSIFAAERVVHDSWRDWLPTGTASFAPTYLTPSGLFQPSRSWRAVVSFTQPIYEGGNRRATKALRVLAVDQARLELTATEIRARSEVRTAQAALASRQTSLASARQAATLAHEVLRVTGAAYELGATTNIEVIDAQRTARDADTAARRAEDSERRARLDLLVALGRFPK
jgi:multidrug efflux system outer membrane protein